MNKTLAFPLCLTLPWLAVFGVGCADAGKNAPQGATITDSAGVQIVVNRWPDQSTPRWEIRADSPLFVIGGRDAPATEFSFIRAARALADGRLLVSDMHEFQLRAFDRTGAELARRLRRGTGPAEMEDAPAIVLKGDTIVAVATFRLVYLDANLDHLRTVNIQRPTNFDDGVPSVVAFREDGRPIAYTLASQFCKAAGPHRMILRFLAMSEDVSSAETLFERPIAPRTCGMVSEGSRSFLSYPDIAYQKSAGVGVTAQSLIMGTGDQFDFEVYDPFGRLQRRVRVMADSLPVTQEWKDAYVQEARSQMERSLAIPEAKARWAKQIEKTQFAAFVPFFERFFTTDEGWLWIMLVRQRAGDTRHYLVFDPVGRLAATAELPPDVGLLQIWSDSVLVRRQDEDDVPRIELHRILKLGQ